MPQERLHMQIRTLGSATHSSQHTAQCLMYVRGPHTQENQLPKQGPTWAFQLAKGLTASFSTPRGSSQHSLACILQGSLWKLYTGAQVSLWATRKNETQAKAIQGKLVMKRCYLRGQSYQTEGSFRQRGKPLLNKRGCLKEFWKSERNVDISTDFVWPWTSGLTALTLNHHFSLPPEAERWQERLQFLPLCKDIHWPGRDFQQIIYLLIICIPT